MQKNPKANQKGIGMPLFFGVSAQVVFIWASWVFLGTLAVGVIATFLIILSGNEKDRLAGIEIAAANKTAAQARRDAEEIRAVNLKLEAQIEPRRLSKKQQASLTELLMPFKGRKIRLESYALDAEGEIFAGQIRDGLSPVLKIDNWIGAEEAGNGFAKGINVTGDDPALVAALAGALRDCGFEGVSTIPLPPPQTVVLAIESSRTKEEVSAVVVIGVKPLKR